LMDADCYGKYLAIKSLPIYRFTGRRAWFPDEYAARIGLDAAVETNITKVRSGCLFDYQRDISDMAIQRKKFCIFADCGLGKTLMFLEYLSAANADLPADKKILILSPLMVVRQTLAEAARFYPGMDIAPIAAAQLPSWLCGEGRIGITNYESIRPGLDGGRLGCMVLDESSMLKSHYGAWGTELIRMGRGVPWKLCCTGTPAPNDRIEYANHAIFMGAHPTVNSFLAKYFVNRGQTAERWEMKPWAKQAFFNDLSHWAFFLNCPGSYGWKDNAKPLPPINIAIHDVQSTPEQDALIRKLFNRLFVTETGGIVKRSMLSQIAKGYYRGKSIPSRKPEFIKELAANGDATIIWCVYNREQEGIADALGCDASIMGATPYEKKDAYIRAFQAGTIPTLISKPKILGFGLNLQIASRQIFSGLQDSYESFYQAVKRSNRFGSNRSLNVDIPTLEIERPMVENVLRKAKNIQADTEEQELLFRKSL